jgi:hypothetical protein
MQFPIWIGIVYHFKAFESAMEQSHCLDERVAQLRESTHSIGFSRKALCLTIVLAACSDSSSGHQAAKTYDEGHVMQRTVPLPIAADAAEASVRVDAALALQPWPDRSNTFAAALRGTQPEPLVLVADKQGIVVRGVDGALRARLVSGAVSQPRYYAEIGVLWFVRTGRVEALDLGGPRGDPVVIIDAMPQLPFEFGGCSAPGPCVLINLRAGTIKVEHDVDLGTETYEMHTYVKKAVRIAASAHPVLTDEGRRFFAHLQDRLGQSLTAYPALDTSTTLPVPPAAGDLEQCDRTSFSPRRGCCEGGCRHGFDLPGLGLRLVVAGRRCDCARDRCEALCALYDPSTGRFAALDHPERLGEDARPLRCVRDVDSTGSAYLFDHQVCSARGCALLRGDALGWLVPGMVILGLPENSSACPEGP